MTSTPFNGGEATRIGSGGDTVTLLGGATFCVSDRRGDIVAGGPHGLFYRDTRVLSRWEARVDGHPPEPLGVHTDEVDGARHILRRPPLPGRADSTLLIVRERLIAEALQETITLVNLDAEDTVVALTVHADADFADLFAVKEGRAPVRSAEAAGGERELTLHDPADRARSTTVTAAGEVAVVGATLNWRVVVPARGQWRTELSVHSGWTTPDTNPAGRQPVPEFHASLSAAHAWRAAATRIDTPDPLLAGVLRRSTNDLAALLIRDDTEHHVSVAAGAPWFMTLFGRDSLLTAWMALPLDVGLAVGTLHQLAALQGRRVDAFTEEQPGRIMHEVRRGPASHDLVGGVYYGSIDATLLFVMLLAESWRWGADDAVVRSLLPAADSALEWAGRYGDRDGDGLVEYRRSTDRGLINQGWKDSFDGINDAAGRTAEAPIALCEVQGYHYAALQARADLADGYGDPSTADRLRHTADELKDQFRQRFWLSERGCYAIALDGRKRPVDAVTSNAAHALWTGIADDDHAAELVQRLADPSMDSGFGLRTLASTMGAYNPMSYHNGSVWPHDTAIAIAGLLRYHHVPGATELAQRLTAGLLDAAGAFGGRLPELYCGFPRDRFAPPIPYPTSCSPQAWASAAPVLVVRSFLGLQPRVPDRTLTVDARLPPEWGAVELTGLRLGTHTVCLRAEGGRASVVGLPGDWTAVGAESDGAG